MALGRMTILAGAGASKAVSPSEFPTTVEFFQRLPDDIKSDSLFNFAENFIQEVERPDQIDIEMILWALETLRKDLDKIQSKTQIIGNILHSAIVNETIPRQNFGSFFDFSSALSSRLGLLISKVNEVVYELYGYEPTKRELDENWLELLNHADGARDSLEIFTTNYDAVIETALDIRLGSETAKSWRGVSGRVRQKLNLKDWAEIGSRNATVTKLHGSLDWRRAGKEIHVGDSNFTGDHTKHAIIYPGFKGQNSSEFFSIFHNYFARALAESSVVIFIGFAFRDEFINSIVRENLTQSTQVHVINPSSFEFPSQRVKVNHIKSGFNKKSISAIEFF